MPSTAKRAAIQFWPPLVIGAAIMTVGGGHRLRVARQWIGELEVPASEPAKLK